MKVPKRTMSDARKSAGFAPKMVEFALKALLVLMRGAPHNRGPPETCDTCDMCDMCDTRVSPARNGRCSRGAAIWLRWPQTPQNWPQTAVACPKPPGMGPKAPWNVPTPLELASDPQELSGKCPALVKTGPKYPELTQKCHELSPNTPN